MNNSVQLNSTSMSKVNHFQIHEDKFLAGVQVDARKNKNIYLVVVFEHNWFECFF